MVTWYSTYVDDINFNELLWNYKFIYYENQFTFIENQTF